MSDGKSATAYRTISEVADGLEVPQHVLRFWETKFTALKPLKRGGNRRYYRPEDIDLLRVIRRLLYIEGYTIRGVQKLLKERGAKALVAGPLAAGSPVAEAAPVPPAAAGPAAVPAAPVQPAAAAPPVRPAPENFPGSLFAAAPRAPTAPGDRRALLAELHAIHDTLRAALHA